MEIKIKEVRGHYEIHFNGKCVRSGDTKKEVEEELEELLRYGGNRNEIKCSY